VLRAIVQCVVAKATWRLGFVDPCLITINGDFAYPIGVALVLTVGLHVIMSFLLLLLLLLLFTGWMDVW
jgi:hypothetical protein